MKNIILNVEIKNTNNNIVPKKRPSKFIERIEESFGINPLLCKKCNQQMILTSITYRSKKTKEFKTKYFDSS